LDRPAAFHDERRAQRFVAAEDFSQASFESGNVQRQVEPEIECLIVVRSLFKLIEKPKPLLPERERVLIQVLPA